MAHPCHALHFCLILLRVVFASLSLRYAKSGKNGITERLLHRPRITEIIAQAKAKDAQFGADLEREFNALSNRLPFGLNFERHRPEAVELPQRPVRKGDKVRILPPRGSNKKGDQRLWQVRKLTNAGDCKLAELCLLDAKAPETQTIPLTSLIVVSEFKDTIYPGLLSTGKVERGGTKPFHTVINGENYHVLKALTFNKWHTSLHLASE